MKNEINAQALAGGLEKLQSGARKRKADQLEVIRESILKARGNGASFRTMERFFRENEIVVSEKTLRRYVREWTGEGGRRRRRRSRTARQVRPVAAAAAVSAAQEAPRPSWKKIVAPEEPREVRDASGRRVPPRLAHLHKSPL